MQQNTTDVIDIDRLASAYAGVLLYLRLLRAAIAYLAYVAVFFLALGLVASIAALNPLLFLAASAATAFFVVVIGLFVLLYSRAVRGSLVAAWVVLVVASFAIFGALVTLVTHALAIPEASPERRGGEVLLAAQALLPAYVAAGLAFGSLAAVRSRRLASRTVLADRGYGRGRRADAYRLLGLPISPTDRRPALRHAMWWAVLALAIEGAAFSVYYFSSNVSEPPAVPLAWGLLGVAIGWPLSLLLLYWLLALAQRARLRARRLAQPTLQQVREIDVRRPVLFLRSFADDQVSLASARMPRLLRVMDPGVVTERLEEIIVLNAAPLGPVIAIGRPGDATAPIGAGRQYLADEEWQAAVRRELASASAVVVSLAGTDGLNWELREIRSGGHLPKTLLVVPPALTRSPAEVTARAATAGVELASTAGPLAADGRMVLACWQEDMHGVTRVIVSSRVSEIDYELAVRLFLAYGNLTWPCREVRRSRRSARANNRRAAAG